jgi:hypothetical protein
VPRYLASFVALGALASLSAGRVAAAPETPRSPATAAADRSEPAQVAPVISRPSVPLRFEPLAPGANGSRVFMARSAGYAVHVGPTWAEIRTAAPTGADAASATPITLRFEGAAPGPREVSLEGAATPVHYLTGADAASWRVGLEARGRVRVQEV